MGLNCPYCGVVVTHYDLRIRMIFDEHMVRHRAGEFNTLSCGCEMPLGTEIYDEYVDDTTRESWFFDPITDKTLLVWCDKEYDYDEA